MTRVPVPRLVVLGVVAVVAVIAPYVVSNYYVTLLSLILATALLAASVNMLAGDAGLFSLGHAGIAAASGYGLAWASRQGFDLLGQLLIAALLTLIASAIYGLISMRTSGVFFLMVTLAAGMVCFGMAYRWSSVTGGDNGLTGIRRPELIGEYWQFYFFVLLTFVLVTVALIRVSRSPFGLALRGIRDSESRMRSLGYNVPGYKFVGVMLSGVVAGLAGILLVWQTEFISPSFAGFEASALALVMIVLGGIGTTMGPLVGTAVVLTISQVLSTYVDRWPTILGVLFIASVILAPQGLIGGIRALASRVRARNRPHQQAEKGNANAIT
jgi:branched-chain amino acid transport system permease protein